jgi:hypothetical protein
MLFNILLVIWNLALLAGLVALLILDIGWVTKLLALIFLPMVVITGCDAWRGLLKTIRKPPR